MDKKIKIISIGLLLLTIVFAILCLFNVVNDSRKWCEEQLKQAHQALVENLEFQDELKGYGSRYSDEISLMETAEEVHRDLMWNCQQKINEYDQMALIFGLLAGGCGISASVIVVLAKRKVKIL